MLCLLQKNFITSIPFKHFHTLLIIWGFVFMSWILSVKKKINLKTRKYVPWLLLSIFYISVCNYD